jgi:hypothetical protein
MIHYRVNSPKNYELHVLRLHNFSLVYGQQLCHEILIYKV